MEPLISVIVPVYNAEKFLDQCLESIVAQTYPHLEILVVDDGSTDGSGEKCDRWAERDERIRVIHQPNGGHSAARNTALDAMTGELVAMVDSDDVLHPEFAATLLDVMRQTGCDIAVGGYVAFSSEHPHFPTVTSSGPIRQYNQEEALQKELENGLSRMLMIRFDIEHLTGKEAIELMKQREHKNNSKL
jgi:glycosyltransferase involved in cell wall biosynthesis